MTQLSMPTTQEPKLASVERLPPDHRHIHTLNHGHELLFGNKYIPPCYLHCHLCWAK